VPDSTYLLQTIGLSKRYVQGPLWKRKPSVRALDNVNLSLPKGKTVALIGKSGSGKTTLAMCLALVEKPDAGEIIFDGHKIKTLDRGRRRAMRRQIQVIFQHSMLALSPRLTTAQLVEEPLQIQRCMPVHERSQLVGRLLEQVGLSQAFYGRRPHELSGGQCQRVAIARSLALSPSLLILDEPFVGLDTPIRNQIVNLLLDLQKSHNLTYLYISHDLRLVRYFADATLIMDHGQLIASEDIPACSN
jgi:ABC-type glutathione transport system ATPase component